MSSAPVPGPSPVATAAKRPSAWWWVLAGALLVAAVACFIVFLALFITTIRGIVEDPQNVTFNADGTVHTVTLTEASKGYVWVDSRPGAVRCTITDAGTGRRLRLSAPSGRMSYNQWTSLAWFPVGSGQVRVTCTGDPFDQVRIGPAPHAGRLVAYLVLMLALPGPLGLAGAGVLIVTIVRLASRPKPYPGHPGHPGYPGPPPPYSR